MGTAKVVLPALEHQDDSVPVHFRAYPDREPQDEIPVTADLDQRRTEFQSLRDIFGLMVAHQSACIRQMLRGDVERACRSALERQLRAEKLRLSGSLVPAPRPASRREQAAPIRVAQLLVGWQVALLLLLDGFPQAP